MSAMPSDRGLLDHLIGIARSLAGEAGLSLSGARAPTVLWDRPDGLVVRLGDVVVKAHAPDTDPGDFAARLRVASSPLLRGVLLPPLLDPPLREARGRLITAWPAGDPVSPEDPDAAPWEDAARLLARLHSTPLAALAAGGPLPRMGGPGRVARAMARLRAAAADRTPAKAAVESVESVESAFALLPAWAQGGAEDVQRAESTQRHALVHGDWHLGQVVHVPGARAAGLAPAGWQLIDIDDLGAGDPAWDLARPAAWYAAGLLPPEVWWRFLSTYRASGGCAVPPDSDGDPWPSLDVPARALAVQSAALAVAAASRDGRPLDEAEAALVDACDRMVRVDALPAP